ncbi:DUF2306 domain-containing protein [Rhodococcus sp. 077-4]|uniref:DUF2306 domain-containing protein n=1 Tax=Rhodococcus sp. 077-4 TaxID=2789271 RepID=UPI0039F5AE74
MVLINRPNKRGQIQNFPDVSLSRFAFWAIVAIAIMYIPLAITYMWFVFDPGAPRIQEAVNTAINGRDYAVGPTTLASVRDADYHRHAFVMTLHTVGGSVALILALLQFASPLRRRFPKLHRWTGRVYLPIMTASMLAAIAFLTLTSTIPYRSGAAFRLQLWALAVGTLASAWYAFVAIRRRDVFRHQAFMAINLSLMMATPLLRVVLIGLAPVLPDATELTNLGVSSVTLGTPAVAAAAVAFMLTQARTVHPRNFQGTPGKMTTYLGLVLASVIGGLLLLWRQQPLTADGVPQSYVVFHLIPAGGYVLICLAGSLRARSAGNNGREQQWRVLLCGAAVGSLSAFLTGLFVSVVYGPLEGFIAGLMLGPTMPIATTLCVLIVQSVRTRSRAHGPSASKLIPDPKSAVAH